MRQVKHASSSRQQHAYDCLCRSFANYPAAANVHDVRRKYKTRQTTKNGKLVVSGAMMPAHGRRETPPNKTCVFLKPEYSSTLQIAIKLV